MPILVTPPSIPVLTLAEAKKHLRVDHDEDDAEIAAMVSAAVGKLDPAFGGWLGRALRPQVWRLTLARFPCGEIVLPFPPLLEVTSFEYTDPAGATQTLAVDSGYRVLGRGGLGKAMLAPLYGQSWPAARADHDSVRITFTAGYPIDGEADALPASIKAWVKLQVGTLYERREAGRSSRPACIRTPGTARSGHRRSSAAR